MDAQTHNTNFQCCTVTALMDFKLSAFYTIGPFEKTFALSGSHLEIVLLATRIIGSFSDNPAALEIDMQCKYRTERCSS